MNRRIALSLAVTALLATAALLVLLTAGQLVKLADLLTAESLARVAGRGTLILFEPVLPLVPLLACGLVYGRLRAEGALAAWAALGASPLQRHAVALLFGVGAAVAGAVLAAGPVPRAVAALRGDITQAALSGLVAAEQQVELPGGGVLQVAGGQAWAVLPSGERLAVLHADSVRGAAVDDSIDVTLDGVWLWAPGLRVSVDSAVLRLPSEDLARRLGMLGPPNALASSRLDRTGPHHAFTWHRRLALPAMAVLWALLGALLGGRLGGPVAVVVGAGAVGLAYWILRVGELNARAGLLPPAFAAWAPAALLALALAAWIARRRRIGFA